MIDDDWPAVLAIIVLIAVNSALNLMEQTPMITFLTYVAFGALCFVAGVLVERKNAAKIETVVDTAKKL